MNFGNANPQHLLRMEKYIEILKSKAVYMGLKSVVSLPEHVKMDSWDEAVKITDNTASNTHKGFKKRNEIIIVSSEPIKSLKIEL